MTDNGLAALAAALHDEAGCVHSTVPWGEVVPCRDRAAAILGERGVFLPGGDCGHSYPACCEYACYEDPGCACEACTIASLRAALDGLAEALKEAAYVHHVTTHSSIAAFADCDQPFCQRVRAALATAKEAGG